MAEAEAILLLGSNLEPERNLRAAMDRLRDDPRVVVRGVSTVFESPAVGRSEQPNYLNAAVLVETGMRPAALRRDVLGPIEQALGRRRTDDAFSSRTIDIDLVLFDETVEPGPRHALPHPDLDRYPHVAIPVAELRPTRRHPLTGESLSDLASRLAAKEARLVARPEIGLDRPQ